MAIKEVRKSIVLLEMGSKQGSIDYGLIRDVILNPDAYTDFLVKEYETLSLTVLSLTKNLRS